MQKRVLPFLLPPLLSSCVGLTTRPIPPDTPALVFVDGQISDSTDIITQTQRRLSPPPAQPTTSLARTAPLATTPLRSAPLPVPVLQRTAPAPQTTAALATPASVPGLTLIGSPGTSAILSLSPARNLTLEQWVRRIIPSGWKLEYENALRTQLNTRIVSVYTNDQWTRVLGRLLTEQSISGTVDGNTQTVRLQRAGQTVTPLVSQSMTPAAPAAAPRNPFSGTPAPAIPAVTPPVVSKTPTQAPTKVTTPRVVLVSPVAPAVGQPVPPALSGKSWRAPSGATLRETLMKWAGDTRCESGASPNWTVIWPAGVTDYRLDAPLTFQGTFEAMLGQMFELYRTARKPLYADASRLQCLVSVSDTPSGH